MDIIQQYALNAIHLYHSADPYLRPIRSTFYEAQSRTLPIIMPMLDRAASWAADSPGVLMVAFFVLSLLVAKVVLTWIWRTIVFWLRIAFWSAVVLVVAAAWQRGFDQTAEDLGRWAAELGRFWMKEYERFEGYQNQDQGLRGSGYGIRR